MSNGLVIYTPIIEMDLEDYIEILQTKNDFPVYGDFLSFFTIKLGDLPSDLTAWLIKIGTFYEELINIEN